MGRHPIGLGLRSLNNLNMRYMINFGNKKKIDYITGTNGWIIGYLSEQRNQDIFQKDLEEEFNITRSTASKVVKLMVQKGLIEQQSVPYDARLKKLILTPKALELTALMKEDGKKMEAALTKGFTEEELDQLNQYLQRMITNMKLESAKPIHKKAD